MNIPFCKYQGTGNDFIILDNRKNDISLSAMQIKKLCNRHFGIGADGLMLLETSSPSDFKMNYFNSDGNQSTMCGNGGRCIVAFAKKLGLVQSKTIFEAIDGVHEAIMHLEKNTNDTNSTTVSLKMNDVNHLHTHETYFELNTGSPHYVTFTEYVSELDIKKEGALIRYSPLFKEEGINVNFVEMAKDNSIFVRTYERGVEDETLSCGTGVTASAICAIKNDIGKHKVHVNTIGGQLSVDVENINHKQFENIWLTGSATFVFEGIIAL